MFQGATQINLDAKGRMAVPTRTRDPLTAGGTVKLVLTAHPDGCLLLYPMPAWEPIRAQRDGVPQPDRRLQPWKRLLIGFAEEIEPDSAGRLLISPELRDVRAHRAPGDVRRPGQPFRDLGPRDVEAQLEAVRSGGSPNLPPGMENFSL